MMAVLLPDAGSADSTGLFLVLAAKDLESRSIFVFHVQTNGPVTLFSGGLKSRLNSANAAFLFY